jgi:hypothetical protein
MWDGRRGDGDRAMMGSCYEAPLNPMVIYDININMLADAWRQPELPRQRGLAAPQRQSCHQIGLI